MAAVVTGLPPRCLIFAVHRETLGLRRLRPWRRLRAAPCPAWVVADDSALVLESGVGNVAATRALSWLLETGWTGGVVSAGFCGALVPDLRVLDLVRATEVIDQEGLIWPTFWPAGAPEEVRAGRVLTASHLVCEPTIKRTLGQQHAAQAVEMEAAALARLCAPLNLPFVCLRVVSDALTTPLSPDLVRLLGGSRVQVGALASALLRRPTLARELWQLGNVTREGADRLGQALLELLTAWR